MPTTNPRLNISFKPATATLLSRMVRRAKKSVANYTKGLVLEALAQREDIELLLLAECREQEQKGKKTYSHKEAWRCQPQARADRRD